MAVRKKSRRARQDKGDNNNSGESEFEARLTPPEEKTNAAKEKSNAANITQSSRNDDTITVDTGDLKLSRDLTEEEEEVHRFLAIDPFVLVILCFSLLFILTIAYVIWSGWEPPR